MYQGENKQSSHNPAHYVLVNDTFLYKGRLVIPCGTPWVQKILEEFHLTPVGGHAGELRTLKG